MSSPPPLGSSAYPGSLNLPRKRPSLNTSQSENPAKRRKPSALSTVSSGHPLRQTSFPPPEASAFTSRPTSFSPPASATGRSTAAGSTTKRGRGGRRKANDARSATGTSATGTERGKQAGSATGHPSAVNGAGADEEDADEDEEDGAQDAVLEAGAIPDEAQQKVERENLRMLIEAFDTEQADRYDMWRRVKLNKAVVRRVGCWRGLGGTRWANEIQLVNQTLSQSVPQSIVTTVNGYTKLFVGELIERARDVLAEWLASSPLLPTEEPNPNYPTTNESSNGTTKDDSATTEVTSQATDTRRIDVKEIDKGPLTPDHLREALRRYKRDREGEGTGYQGLSLYGTANTANRSGGKRLFR